MNDFADFFSPILVKELRQGMRTKVFLGIFLVIQFFMIISVLVSLENGSNRSAVDGMFWTFIGAATLFAMPMRGLPALNAEIKGNTLELMMLTQLSAWRITAGKWLALFLQTLLVICAVLPYVVVRYFLGGVDLVEDLKMLAWMVMASALLSAITVGLSPFMQTVIGRIGLGFGMLVCMQVVPSCIMFSRMSGMHSSSGLSLSAFNCFVIAALMGPLVILQFFELGVGKIAPSAENHSSRKRLLAVGLVGLAALLGHQFHQYGPLLAMASVLSAPVVLGAFMEDTSKVPSLYRPFVRRNALGKLAGRIFYPGWATGLLFALVLGGVLFACSFSSLSKDDDALFFWVSAVEAVIAPLALVRFMFRRAKNIVPYYFGLQVILFVLAIVISAGTAGSYPRTLPIIFKMLPTAGFFLNLWNRHSSDTTLPFSLAITIASILLLFVVSLNEWRLIKQMEEEAAKLD